MNKIRDILRLVLTTALSDREIGQAVAVAKNTVRRYRVISADTGLQWQHICDRTAHELDDLINKRAGSLTIKRMPDFAHVHEQLALPMVTLQLLWEEYRLPSPEDALSYSQFTHHYRRFKGHLALSMRQVHLPGEKAFVDFSGKRPCYVNKETGEAVCVELFVGVLGFSNFTFALAVESQSSPDWVEANVQMLNYFGRSKNYRPRQSESGSHKTWLTFQAQSDLLRACQSLRDGDSADSEPPPSR